MRTNLLALPLVIFTLARTCLPRASQWDVVLKGFEPTLVGLAALQFLLANQWL